MPRQLSAATHQFPVDSKILAIKALHVSISLSPSLQSHASQMWARMLQHMGRASTAIALEATSKDPQKHLLRRSGKLVYNVEHIWSSGAGSVQKMVTS